MSAIRFPDLMLPSAVSHMFKVDPKTVRRWAKAGKLTSIRTPGGHRRYVRFQAEALLTGRPLTREETIMLEHLSGGQP